MNLMPQVWKRCCKWFHRFKNENESIEDEQAQGRPEIYIKEINNIQNLQQNPRSTYLEIGQPQNCSESTIRKRLHAMKIGRLTIINSLLTPKANERFIDCVIKYTKIIYSSRS